MPSATALAPPALEARGLHKSYGAHQVLRGADLSVAPGQLVAVVGENGAGKSTLLKALAGVLAADRGEVSRRGTLGHCPQEPVLNDSLTLTCSGSGPAAGTGRGDRPPLRAGPGLPLDLVEGPGSWVWRARARCTASVRRPGTAGWA
ncbi:ATP-binding cassette domain-containing protein [Streptomyces sp. DSM 116494]